jgi:hypothetical protein
MRARAAQFVTQYNAYKGSIGDDPASWTGFDDAIASVFSDEDVNKLKGSSRSALGSMNKENIRNMTFWDFKKNIHCTVLYNDAVLISKLFSEGEGVAATKNKCWSVCKKVKETPETDSVRIDGLDGRITGIESKMISLESSVANVVSLLTEMSNRQLSAPAPAATVPAPPASGSGSSMEPPPKRMRLDGGFEFDGKDLIREQFHDGDLANFVRAGGSYKHNGGTPTLTQLGESVKRSLYGCSHLTIEKVKHLAKMYLSEIKLADFRCGDADLDGEGMLFQQFQFFSTAVKECHGEKLGKIFDDFFSNSMVRNMPFVSSSEMRAFADACIHSYSATINNDMISWHEKCYVSIDGVVSEPAKVLPPVLSLQTPGYEILQSMLTMAMSTPRKTGGGGGGEGGASKKKNNKRSNKVDASALCHKFTLGTCDRSPCPFSHERKMTEEEQEEFIKKRDANRGGRA